MALRQQTLARCICTHRCLALGRALKRNAATTRRLIQHRVQAPRTPRKQRCPVRASPRRETALGTGKGLFDPARRSPMGSLGIPRGFRFGAPLRCAARVPRSGRRARPPRERSEEWVGVWWRGAGGGGGSRPARGLPARGAGGTLSFTRRHSARRGAGRAATAAAAAHHWPGRKATDASAGLAEQLPRAALHA